MSMEDCSRVGRAASLRLTALLLCVTKFLRPAVLVVLGPPGRRGWRGIILTLGNFWGGWGGVGRAVEERSL